MISDGHGKFTPGKQAEDFLKTHVQHQDRQLETQESMRVKIGLDPIDQATRDLARRVAEKKELEMFNTIFAGADNAPSQTFTEQDFLDMANKITNNTVAASGIPNSALTFDPNSNRATVEREQISRANIINQMTKKEMIQSLLIKMNMVTTPSMVDAVESYVERHGKSIFAGFGNEQKEEDPDDFLDEMRQKLLKVHGVTGVQPMLDNYPDYASIIVKINMSKFDDEDVDEYMTQIDRIVQDLKPEHLMELEVIYHNKVVY